MAVFHSGVLTEGDRVDDSSHSADRWDCSRVGGDLGLQCFRIGSNDNGAAPAITSLNGSDGVVTKVQNRKWDRRRDGDRRRYRDARYRYFYGGYYYASPWWQVGVGVPGVVVGIPTPWGPAWFTYCERKYVRLDLTTARDTLV